MKLVLFFFVFFFFGGGVYKFSIWCLKGRSSWFCMIKWWVECFILFWWFVCMKYVCIIICLVLLWCCNAMSNLIYIHLCHSTFSYNFSQSKCVHEICENEILFWRCGMVVWWNFVAEHLLFRCLCYHGWYEVEQLVFWQFVAYRLHNHCFLHLLY